MAVYKGIGKIGEAIRAGVKAYDAINHGPVTNPKAEAQGGFRGTWGHTKDNSGTFIWGVHRWGSKEGRVGR